MTTTIVPANTTAVKLAEAIAHADMLKATWEASGAARDAAFTATAKARFNSETNRALLQALQAEHAAHDAWKAAEAVVRDAYAADLAADEAAYEAMLCAQYDAMEWNYPDYQPIPYAVTEAGRTYLDHHYHTTLADGGESPYGDGTTGWVQPSPVPSYYQCTPDLDARDRLENLAY